VDVGALNFTGKVYSISGSNVYFFGNYRAIKKDTTGRADCDSLGVVPNKGFDVDN